MEFILKFCLFTYARLATHFEIEMSGTQHGLVVMSSQCKS